MDKVFTIDQIESQFADEWISVGDPHTNEHLEVLSGTVLHHSKDRDEVYNRAIALAPEHGEMLYTGEITEDFALNLGRFF